MHQSSAFERFLADCEFKMTPHRCDSICQADHATGVRVQELPVKIEDLLKA